MTFPEISDYLNQNSCSFFLDKKTSLIHHVLYMDSCPHLDVANTSLENLEIFPNYESFFQNAELDFASITDDREALNASFKRSETLRNIIPNSGFCRHCFFRCNDVAF